MALGQWLQVVGAAIELGGLGTVALGISETRRTFTDRPSIARRLVRRVGSAIDFVSVRVLHRRRDAIVAAGTVVGRASLRGRAYGTVVAGSMDDLSAEEKIERLRQMVNTHAATLTKLESRLDTEQDERRKADAEAERRLLSLDQDLRAVIAEAASGGIRLQTAGVVLFAFGLIVGLIGNLLA